MLSILSRFLLAARWVMLSALVLAWLVGCVAIEVIEEDHIYYANERLPSDVFDQVHEGMEQSWLLDYIGEPAKVAMRDDQQVWLYPLSIEQHSGGRIIFLYSNVDVGYDKQYFYVCLQNNRVTEHGFSSTLPSEFASPQPDQQKEASKSYEHSTMAASAMKQADAATSTTTSHMLELPTIAEEDPAETVSQ